MSFLSGITDSISNAFPGQKTGQAPTDNRYDVFYKEDAFNRKIQKIVPENWNLIFKYYFKIAVANRDGVVSQSSTDFSDIPAFKDKFKDTGKNKPVQYLFLPPQSISITTSFASSVIATNTGIFEENNGTVFKTITISGTTGVWPQKPFQQKKAGSIVGNLLTTIFPGAISAISSLASSVTKTVNAVTGGGNQAAPGPLDSPTKGQDTGYYQFWALHNFFVAYSEAKKLTGGDRLRFIFGSPKDNIEYICTPVQFDLRRDASNPLLYRYQIVLRAWDTSVYLLTETPVDLNLPTPQDVNAITSITNALRDARSVIVGAENVIKAVNSDFVNVMLVFNQANLVLKEASAVGEDLGDFGTIFKNNANYLLKGPSNSFYSSLQSYEQSTGTPSPQLTFTSVDEKQPLTGSSSSTVSAAGGSVNSSQVTPGGESVALTNARLNIATGVLNAALQDPTFIQNPVTNFDIPPNVESQLEDARTAARQLTSGDIRNLTDNLQQMSDNHAQSVNLMDPSYAAAFGIPTVTTTTQPTDDDIIINSALQIAKMNLSSTLATGQIFRDRDLDPFAIANENLADDDQLSSPSSSYSIPFPRGRSLEDIAAQFLNDSDRWREIVLLNALRAPYIDEDGFDLPIFSANGRTFVVKDISKLTISQNIVISANTVSSTKRSILNIQDIGGNQWRITVDGQDNLSAYIPLSSPSIHARIPGCVGSGDIILLPSNSTPDDPISVRPNALYAAMTHAEKVFKIDLALDPKFARDLVVDHTGDVKRSYGYDNGAQAIRLALETEQNELERHPNYGVAVPIGGRNSNISTTDFEDIVSSRVRADPRFLDADVSASINGSVVNVSVVAHGAAGTGKVPVEFEIGKAQ